MAHNPSRKPGYVGDTASCAFPPCGAILPIRYLQAHPGNDRVSRAILPSHELVPDGEYGTCPGSLMTIPVNADTAATLRGCEASYARWKAGRKPAERKAPAGPAWEHSKTPHPSADRGWFESPSVTTGRPPLGRLPVTEENKIERGGASLASTAEVRAAIDQANVLAAEAQGMAQAAAGKFAEAHALIEWVRGSTADPLGSPMLSAGMESCESATRSAHQAIEANNTYAGGL